ncbi:MAG TPA: hypothetical protein VGA69_01180 [Nitriliruptorales bacterium]
MSSPTEAPEREVDVLRAAMEQLEFVLPSGWEVGTWDDEADARLDAVACLTGPNNSGRTLVIEAKRLVQTRDVPTELDRLARRADEAGIEEPLLTLVARYLSASTRTKIEALGGNYLDATGNIRIASDKPALYIRVSGADRDPWRGPGRPRGGLRGAPAARVVRALIDFAPPYSVPDLIERSGASTGATYRVVEFLEQEDLIQREERGPITDVAWRQLLERWSQDYGLDRAQAVRRYLEPRGIDVALDRLRECDPSEYVITGSVAAHLDAPYAPARLLAIYLEDLSLAEGALELRPVSQGTNVMVAANKDDFAFCRSRVVDGLNYAAPSQVAVDLLSLPGRSPSEGEELLNWMERNEDAWRR